MPIASDQTMLDILERVRNRFYGKYRGTVTDIDASTLRIKATVPSVLGTQPTGWAMPCVPYAGDNVGIAFLPEQGSGVWIEFEGGDVSFPIWTGCYWNSGDIPSAAASTLKTIITAAGSLAFDTNASSVTLEDAATPAHTAVIDSSGVTLTGSAASTVAVGAASVSINNGALEVM